MKQPISAPNTVPTANIAVNKSRLKVYTNAGSMPTYYLQKGQEFSIELANPTKDVILAKIILNGNPISQGGLVLKPGQRIWLERYIDVAKKFLFDTYEVSGSEEMKAAIADNGDIKVEFYRERKEPTLYTRNGNTTITLGNYHNGTDPSFLRTSTTGGASGAGITTTSIQGFGTFYSSSIPSFDASNGSYSSASSWTADNLGFMDSEYSRSIAPTPEPEKTLLSRRISAGHIRVKKAKTVETGRVEEGSASDQEFKTVNKSFDYYPFHTIEYKMLPVSQKINTAEDLNVKVYCTNCGHKLGKTDKFCSSCGTKK